MADPRASTVHENPGHPCVSVDAEGARFALHPPTPFALSNDGDSYKLLLPYGLAALDVSLDGAAPRRIRARPGDLILAGPGTRLDAAYVEPLEFLLVVMGPERVRRAAEAASGPGWRTRNLLPWHDPGAVALGAEMRRVLLGEGLSAPAYLGALADALVTRVVLDLPADAVRSPAPALAPAKLARVLRHIDAAIAGPISASSLAALAGLSPAHFARAFARETGDPPHRFVMKRRVCRARDMLSAGGASIAEVAARTGFSSQAHLSTAFLRETGTSPARYRAAFGTREVQDDGW